MTPTDKVLVQIGDEIIELKGADKEAFLARVAEDTAAGEAALAAKAAAPAAKAALLERLGITAEEAALLLA
jgi:hypothetical protein